jgi:hypothetical protein
MISAESSAAKAIASAMLMLRRCAHHHFVRLVRHHHHAVVRMQVNSAKLHLGLRLVKAVRKTTLTPPPSTVVAEAG